MFRKSAVTARTRSSGSRSRKRIPPGSRRASSDAGDRGRRRHQRHEDHEGEEERRGSRRRARWSAPMTAIRTPARDGPSSAVARCVPSTIASPARRCARRRRRAPGGSAAAPRSTGPGSSRREHADQQQGNVSQAGLVEQGIASISGARAASPMTIVVRAPSFADDRAPLGIPSSATGSTSTARTRLILAGDPVRGEHEPRQREEGHLRAERRTASAVRSATSGRRSTQEA